MVVRRFGSTLVAIVCALVLGSAASADGKSAKSGDKKPAPEKSADKPAGDKPAASADKAPPAGHKFAKVQVGMSDAEVRKILGEPDDEGGHVTGKAFIPYYYGSDVARIEWVYKGSGIIQFTANRWSHRLKVVRVVYDPTK